MSSNKVIFGLVLVLLGSFFLLNSLGVIDWDFGDFVSFVLPLGLILLGIWFILRRRPDPPPSTDTFAPPPPPRSGAQYQAPPSSGSSAQYQAPPIPPGGGQTQGPSGRYKYKYTYEFGGASTGPSDSAGGRIKYSKFAGDSFIDCCNIDLRNIEVSTFAGNNEIKLHGGKLSPGLNRLVISGFIGDVRILVPPDMPVLCTSSSFIGDVELLGRRTSGLGNTIDARTDNYDSAEAKLYIAVNHFIGDVRVYVV